MPAFEPLGLWNLHVYGAANYTLLFPGAAGAAVDPRTPSVWSLDPVGTLKGWRIQSSMKDEKSTFGVSFVKDALLVQRRIQFNKKHDVILDAIAHKITFVTYSQGGVKVSRDMGSPEAEPHSTPLQGSSRCVSAALTPDAKYVVGGGRDGSVSMWCCETGDLLQCFSQDSCATPLVQANAHDDWVTCIAVAAANDEQRAATPGIEYIVVSVAFDGSLKVWGVGVPPHRTSSAVGPQLSAAVPDDAANANHSPPNRTTSPAVQDQTADAATVAAATPELAADGSNISEGTVTLLHEVSDPRGRIDSVVLSADCSILIVAITGTEVPRTRQQLLLSHTVSARGVPEHKVTESLWNDSAQYSRTVLQLGPMGRSLLVQTVRSKSVRLDMVDARTLRQRHTPYGKPERTAHAVLCPGRMIHVAPSPVPIQMGGGPPVYPMDSGSVTVSLANYDL